MTTRREFLGNILTLPALLALVEAESAQAGAVFDPDFFPGLAPAYPDPARTAILDRWLDLVEQSLQKLELFWELLAEARSLPPSEVDVKRFHQALEQAKEAIESLDYDFDHGDLNIDDILESVTSQPIGDLLYLWGEAVNV
ncbi:MAG: hypothetical protein KJ077_08190 [Anaerolineae bacterium]|nr:hypothetical protein [Anaerolineae bacterium]